MHNFAKAALWAVFLGLCCSVPYVGYIAGIILGAFLLFMSIYIWFPYQSAHGDLSYLMDTLINTAMLLVFGFLVFQIYKVNIEKNYYKRAVTEINSTWKQINAQEGNAGA